MSANPADRRVHSAMEHRVARPSRPATARLVGLAIGCVVLAVSAAGCAPPQTGEAGDAPLLYVANGLDDTISRVDSRSGRVVGAALPGGQAPRQIVVGPSGSLLVLSAAVEGRRPLTLTYITGRGGAWTARPISLEPGARRALVAGDGGRYALVAYHMPDGAPGDGEVRCRLAVVDLATGQVGEPRTVCAGRDQVVGLAQGGAAASGGTGDGTDGGSADRSAAGTAYLAVWRRPAAEEDCVGPSGSRIVALRAATGAAVAVVPVEGVPAGLVLAPAPGRLGRRVYALEATPAAGWWLPDACEHMTYGEHLTAAGRWAALGLGPATLEVESRQDVGQPLHAFTVAPEGDRAYALGATGAVVSLDLTSGSTTHLAMLPDTGLGLAVTADRVYVPNTYGDAVWALDRRDGRRLQIIATGRRPIGVALGAGRPR